MKKRKLGIIGGSGLYNIEGFENQKWKKVKSVCVPCKEKADKELLEKLSPKQS